MVGGDSHVGSVKIAEIWDSETGRFLPAGAPHHLGYHLATLLADGRVAIFGGWLLNEGTPAEPFELK